jgi:hypothetical protein
MRRPQSGRPGSQLDGVRTRVVEDRLYVHGVLAERTSAFPWASPSAS